MLLGKSITQLKELIETKQIKISEVREFFLRRINKYNKSLNAFLTINEIESIKSEGKLGGIPLAVKDNLFRFNSRNN